MIRCVKTRFQNFPLLLVDYPDNNAAWRVFLNTIYTAGGILGYDKAAALYFKELLQQFYDDNVQYVEVRSLLDFVS